MTDDREPFREARAAGKAASQAKRLENATYTAAEVKVLTAKAREETARQIAVAIAEHRREFTIGSAVDTELFVAQEIALMAGRQAPE
jgi:hypothetical protein